MVTFNNKREPKTKTKKTKVGEGEREREREPFCEEKLYIEWKRL